MPDPAEWDFTANRRGVEFVGDITYIHTWQAFIYLATVIEAGAIFYSDCGSVFNSPHYRSLITRLGMSLLMGKTSVCWNNALAASFLSVLKNERVRRNVYGSKSQAKRDVFAHIEVFYNRRRRHPSIGCAKPHEYDLDRTRQPLTA